MDLFIFSVLIAVVFYWFFNLTQRKASDHICNQLGNCSFQCPWCKTWGLFAYYQTGDRNYSLCKWCGKVQDKGKEIVQCFLEICPSCVPNYKKLEEWEGIGKRSKISNMDKSSKKALWHTWTMSPGHPCPRCQTKMVVFNPKINPSQLYKDNLYKFHGYDSIEATQN